MLAGVSFAENINVSRTKWLEVLSDNNLLLLATQ